MAKDRTLVEVEQFFMDRFHQQWFFWSEVTRMINVVEENELHRKQGFRDLSSWLSSIRLKTVAGVSRYQPGRPPSRPPAPSQKSLPPDFPRS